jgi:uncharacterized protein (TIGR02246 family)
MNSRNSTLIGLLLLTAIAIPGCFSTANRNNSYQIQPEHGVQYALKGQETNTQAETQTEAKPQGEAPAEATHRNQTIEVVAKPGSETPANGHQAPEKTTETQEPKAAPPKLDLQKVPSKPLTPAERAKAAKLKVEQDAVEAVTTKWMALVTSGRPTASEEITSLYTQDATVIGPDTPEVRNGPEEIRRYFKNFTQRPNLAITGYSGNVRIYGDTAVETGYYTFAYDQGEKRAAVPARFSLHYRRVKGEWKIDDHHSSRLPGAASQQGDT